MQDKYVFFQASRLEIDRNVQRCAHVVAMVYMR
jgi:hypothetical protein